jgi:hypothetical protein
VTTEASASVLDAVALPPDDDGDFDAGGGDSSGLADHDRGPWESSAPSVLAVAAPEPPSSDSEPEAVAPGSCAPEPVDLQRLLRAGIEASLRELDARLSLSEILRRLSDAGVDGERVDVPAAAAFVLSASARPVGDPSAYVAAAIVREPARWPSNALPALGPGEGGPTRPTCEVQGHRYLDEFRVQCVRCGEEREGWRDERYAAEQAQADRADDLKQRAVAS